MDQNDRIVPRGIEDEMKKAYIDYSMSVIVSRALPDVRDGLKPVHRRVLYGMSELGIVHNRAYKKSARVVGEVLGKYHPHGDTAVYDTMVRMAQNWSLRYPLVDGQGNFGSVDGDSPAAMRYTEVRFKKIAEEMLADLEKNTVEFSPNFDDSLKEPTVLPSRIPNLLMNGSSGIAVGMATNMAPHNLREIVAGMIAYLDNNDITIPELMNFIKAPDFPTGGIIYGYEGVKDAFMTGRGRVVVRALASIETNKQGKERIIITEIPFMVNKAGMVTKIAELMGDKKLDGISEVRDESDRDGLRVVVELKRDADANVVLNQLYKQTQMQTTFGVNNIALVKGRPMTLNLKDLIVHYIEHRHEIVVRRTQYDLDQALQRAHILEGLIIALDNLDAVIKLIRESINPEAARNGLMANFGLSEIQSKAILDMRLQRLTGLEMDKIRAEYAEIMKKIEWYRQILADINIRIQIIKDELTEVAKEFGDERRTQIVYSAEDFSIEDMIANEDVIITITHDGYIKRTPINSYRKQNRGGQGSKGTITKEDDFVEHLFIASTHNYMLFFTELGRCFWLKVFEIPEGSKQSKGRNVVNLIQLPKEDKIKAFINVPKLNDKAYIESHYIVMVTKNGTIKKTSVEEYSRPRVNGIIAINIKDGDELIDAQLTDGTSEIIIATNHGQAIRFNESHVRDMGRGSTGVRGISIDPEKGENVVGMVVFTHPDTQLLVISENGFGKRSHIDEYRITNRGGKGVKTINITPKTGKLIAIKLVLDTDDLMIITKDNNMIRMAVSGIREAGRATQGVILIRIKEGDSITAISKLAESDDETPNTQEPVEGEDNDTNFE